MNANLAPISLNFQEFIHSSGDELTTTLLHMAAVFGKRHDHVLAKADELVKVLPPEFTGPNFRVSEYIDPTGRRLRTYEITRDAFSLLAMGFTGKKALMFKLAFIQAFNAMAAYIKNQREGLRYRCMEKELECRDSARRGSFHGKGLNLRKQEKPVLEAELEALRALAQPSLLN